MGDDLRFGRVLFCQGSGEGGEGIFLGFGRDVFGVSWLVGRAADGDLVVFADFRGDLWGADGADIQGFGGAIPSDRGGEFGGEFGEGFGDDFRGFDGGVDRLLC